MLVGSAQTRRRLARPLLFASPKCRVAIPVNDVLFRYALQQASLDCAVREINYRVGPRVECPPISLTGAVLRKEGGAFLLRVHEVRHARGEEEGARLKFVLQRYGLQLLERDAQDIFHEPLFSNAKNVWSHAGERVSLIDRLKFSVALGERPQRIIDLEAWARPNCDVLGAVCALACENLVQLNLHDAPLGPETIVEA